MLLQLQPMESEYSFDEVGINALGGSMKFGDCYIVQQLLRRNKPKQCLEIGSFLGFSANWLLENSAEWNMHLTAVDPNIRHRVFENPRDIMEKINARFIPDRLEIVTAFFGAHPDWTKDYEDCDPPRSKAEVRKVFADRREIDGSWNRTFDCIFIDAAHDYYSVMDGFRNALKLLNSGGIILFHDALSETGVNRTLKELKVEFEGKTRVEIIDGSNVLNHPNLDREMLKKVDGIGFFKLM